MGQAMSEEVLKQILQYLWQQHVQSEQQYLYLILLAPIMGLLFFLILWYRHRAHCESLLDAIAFFFAPRGPSRMLIFKDLAGSRFLVYDYRVLKGKSGYLVQAGPYLLKTSEDPEAYAEPVSLLDARGPPGIPSPFGLWVRQLVASYIILAVVIVSFANTAWTTVSVYGSALGVGLTTVDVLSIIALTLALSWFLATLMRALAPQTLLVSLSAIGASEGFLEASPALDAYSSFPPCKLLRSIGREIRIVIGRGAESVMKRLSEELGDESLAASILALLGHVYEAWQKTTGIVLKNMYDISVAARANYHLKSVKLPQGFLSRYAGILALLAIFIAIAVLIIWLQPSIQPVQTNTTTVTGVGYPCTPASPATIATHSMSVTPATPPPPSGGG